MAYKSERDWKDIDVASRRMMLVGFITFLGLWYGLWNQANKAAQMQRDIVKTQMIQQSR